MRRLKKITLSIFIFFTFLSLFMLSFGIFVKDGKVFFNGAFYLICVIIFWISAAVIAAIFIIDREKPLLFAALYIAAVALGVFLPAAGALVF